MNKKNRITYPLATRLGYVTEKPQKPIAPLTTRRVQQCPPHPQPGKGGAGQSSPSSQGSQLSLWAGRRPRGCVVAEHRARGQPLLRCVLPSTQELWAALGPADTIHPGIATWVRHVFYRPQRGSDSECHNRALRATKTRGGQNLLNACRRSSDCPLKSEIAPCF